MSNWKSAILTLDATESVVLRVKCESGESAEETLDDKYEGGLSQLSRDVSEYYNRDDNDHHSDVYVTSEDPSEEPEGPHLKKIHENVYVERPDPKVRRFRIQGGGLVCAPGYIAYLQSMHQDDPVRAFWILAEGYPSIPADVMSDLLAKAPNVKTEVVGKDHLNVIHTQPQTPTPRLERYVRDTDS